MKIAVAIGLLSVLGLAVVAPAMAAVNVSAFGEVIAIDGGAGTFQLRAESGDLYEVIPPAEFALSDLSIGDEVLVEGTLDSGVITASSVVILEDVELRVVGEVIAIRSLFFVIRTADGVIYRVLPPEDFDLSSLEREDRVLVQGSFVDGRIEATSVTLLSPFDDEDGPFAKDGYYCRTPSARHPALNSLALAYDEPYSELLYYFCEWRFGVGEIKLALQTAENSGLYFGEILEMKRELGGWGQVWQQLGERANEHEGGPPPWAGCRGNGRGHDD